MVSVHSLSTMALFRVDHLVSQLQHPYIDLPFPEAEPVALQRAEKYFLIVSGSLLWPSKSFVDEMR